MLNEEVIFLCYLGKKFSFCGCGWSKQTFCWSQEDEVWIDVIVDLFVKLFGEAYLDYTHSKDNGSQVTEVSDPKKTLTYDHNKWEESFETVCLPSFSALLQISASGILQGPESAFVDNLMDGSVVFEGSKVIHRLGARFHV